MNTVEVFIDGYGKVPAYADVLMICRKAGSCKVKNCYHKSPHPYVVHFCHVRKKVWRNL